MIPDITELNFPKIDGKQYATLAHATPKLDDMGEKNITTQVRIDGEIVPDFSFDWEVEFQGEKYIMPLRIPAGEKGNESLKSEIKLPFQHWAIYQLKRWPFVTIQQIAAGTYLPDEEVATVQLNLKDFCILCGQVLEHYYGETITIDLNPAWKYKRKATVITISHTKIWNVLTNTFHSKYGVRWEIKAAAGNSNTAKGGERYVIRVGYPAVEVNHIFEYGFEGGLLKIGRQVQSEKICNMLKGRGGSKNIPFRYFKDTDPNNPDFRPDPDWVEELKNIYFTNLMPATFRSYIQGWKAAHISKYPGYTAVGENNAYAPWAYRKGYTDAKFDPVEFVADEIALNPTAGDRQVEIRPGFSPYVKKGSSLDKYGPLPDTLDNNEDYYPTIQGTGMDIVVAVEQIESDDVAESTENDARLIDVDGCKYTAKRVAPRTYETVTLPKTKFTVPAGQTATLITDNVDILSAIAYAMPGALGVPPVIVEVAGNAELVETTVRVYNATTQQEHSASGIPAGDWYYEITAKIHNLMLSRSLDITVGIETPKLQSATLSDETWKNTFDIWVKNIWGTTKLSTETNAQYAERVWKPILGDRDKNTAKVVFTSGALLHEDYEFTIVNFPVLDTSEAWEEKDSDGKVIATHTSYWRIKLAKSDAELEATGLYVPSTQKQGKAGDTFAFVGTEMVHKPYVTDAEIRLDNWKKDQLGEVKEIKPTAVVTTDRVRLNNEGKPNALINQLRVGNSLRLFDKRFFNEEGKAYETLYLQSITYTYREPSSDDAALNPDVAIVLGNEYTTSANPVSLIQGEVSALQRQIGSISNVEQIVRAVGDRLYMRKDGIPEISLSPTRFFSLLTSGGFRAGLIGGAGWGFYKDENGNWVLEADRVNVRQEMQVNTLVINQAEGRGGMEIDTAAFMEVTRVVETTDGYLCYFDQKGGSIANLFHVGDVAYTNRWTAENADLKFYKRRVTAVGADCITLTKERNGADRPTDWPDSGVNGTGIPAEGDNIIHFGSYTDKTRQYIKVRDVVGGGYERFLDELNSVNAEGVEYYFVGKQDGESRWFVGNKDRVPYSGKGDGSYIEYKDRKFNLNNVALSLTTTIGDTTIGDYITETANDLLQVEYSQTGADNTWHKVWQETDKYMRQSKDGGKTWTGAMLISGKDGTSVTTTSTEVRYSTEHTESQPADNTFTLINVPTLSQGQYLWSRTKVTYSDGNGTTTYGVSRNGLNGINGTNGRGVVSTAITYQLGDSGTVAPTGTWSTNVPTLTKGKYLWTRSVTTYTSGDPTTLYSVSYIAKDGNDGKDGLPGKDGAGIVSTTITYAKSTSYANPPASGWQTAIPNVPEGQYLWTRTVWEYSDGDSETGYSVARQGADGESVTITSTEVRYAKGDYPTQPADTAFTLTSVGTLTKGQWLWTRTTVYYSDGAHPTSYTAAYIGSDGIQGIPGTPGEDGKTPYLHFAYAAGITGSLPHPTAVTGFSTTSFAGAKYIGICTDYDADDPTTDVGATYEWSEYRGADGSSFANNILWNSNFQNKRTDWADWGGGNTSRILVTEDDKNWMHIITRGDKFQGIHQGDARMIYAQEKTYTVSALVRSDTAGQHIYLTLHCISKTGANLVQIDKRFDVGTTPQRVSATFKAAAGTTRLRLMVGAATTDPIDVYVTDLKIEEGENSNTQWTPNPEEMIGKDAPYTVFQWAIGDFTQPTGTWSDHPLNPKPGEAVWMRQGTVTPPSTTPVWDTSNYMRVTGTAGQSGSDVYLLDIDNEVIAVACDSGGNPLSGQFPVKAKARVYKGGTEVTSGVAFSSEYNPEVSATLSGGDITVGALYADNSTLTITATVAGLTLYSTIRLYKVKPGANGTAAVVYSIEPSVNIVTKSLTTGLSTNQLTCTKYKTTGASARTTTKENTLKATIYTNGMAGTEQIIANALKETGTVALTNDTTGVAFALYNSSGVELDREFVPVISDASGLQIGGTNLLRKTNQGTENWITSTGSNATPPVDVSINLSPADDAQGVVLTNMAQAAVSNGWQMIGFRLPSGILKTQRYYTLSFTAKADAPQTVSGRVQISGSTGGNLITNILNFNFSPDETRHTFLLRTNSTAQTNVQSLWCYLFCNARWNTIEIRDLKLEEGTVATEWSPAPQDFNYITSALQESGRSEGGLILASLLRLGYTVEDGEYRVMSGINGIANPAAENRDIAIWAGGEMRDATDPENSDYDDNAAYAIRHDGNGYACQGNVRFIGGRILIGKNRDAAGNIKSDEDFAKDCVALDGEGLTLYKNGAERLIVADRSVGTDFISKEEATNWSLVVRRPEKLAFKQYHTHTEGLMSPDGEIITQPVDSYDWFATGKATKILEISPGAATYPNRIIPVGEVLSVSNFTTHVTNTAFTGQKVHLTATLQLCYDDSSGKRVVVATGKGSFVRNSATPSRWQATISLGKHTVQVAAAYYLNAIVSTTTPTHGKETGASVTPVNVNMTASGNVRKSNDNVTIIGIDGMVSLWGNGGILINSNGAKIKGSLIVNNKTIS